MTPTDDPRPGVYRRTMGGKTFGYEPLGDDAVIRFQLPGGEAIDVRMGAGGLKVQHVVGTSGARLAVKPEYSNSITLVLLPEG